MINNLQALYKANFSHFPETVIRDLEATEEIQRLRKEIKAKIPGSNWTLIRAEILLEMQQLLDIPLQPILTESWKTHQDVSREIDAQKISDADDPCDSSIVNLADHEIRSTHSPSLYIRIADSVHPLRLFIGITLELRNVALRLQEGDIKEILSGTVSGKGFMQYQNATLTEKDFLDFDIAGKITSAKAPNIETQTDPHPNPIKTTHIDESDIDQLIETPSIKEEKKSLSFSSKLIQFIVGISIALTAVYLFWQFK